MRTSMNRDPAYTCDQISQIWVCFKNMTYLCWPHAPFSHKYECSATFKFSPEEINRYAIRVSFSFPIVSGIRGNCMCCEPVYIVRDTCTVTHMHGKSIAKFSISEDLEHKQILGLSFPQAVSAHVHTCRPRERICVIYAHVHTCRLSARTHMWTYKWRSALTTSGPCTWSRSLTYLDADNKDLHPVLLTTGSGLIANYRQRPDC
jgi:hypothetical protein